MKLFISYRRAAWSFTYWLAEELGKLIDAEIFVDFSGIDETNFETGLLRNLRESDAVLLIVDEHTFADRIHKDSDWVRREIREALSHNKPIVLALHNGLVPPADLPDDIQDVRIAQGIEFYPRYFKAGVHELAAFFDRATPINLRQPVAAVTPQPAVPESTVKSDKALFDEATALAESGQYEQAIQILEDVKARGYSPRFTSLDEVLAGVQRQRDTEQRRWEAGIAYDEIASLARIDIERAQKAWLRFRPNYPEFTDDPAKLGEKLASVSPRIEVVTPLDAGGLGQEIAPPAFKSLRANQKKRFRWIGVGLVSQAILTMVVIELVRTSNGPVYAGTPAAQFGLISLAVGLFGGGFFLLIGFFGDAD